MFLALLNSCFMHYFSSKPSNRKNADKYSPGQTKKVSNVPWIGPNDTELCSKERDLLKPLTTHSLCTVKMKMIGYMHDRLPGGLSCDYHTSTGTEATKRMLRRIRFTAKLRAQFVTLLYLRNSPVTGQGPLSSHEQKNDDTVSNATKIRKVYVTVYFRLILRYEGVRLWI